MHGGRKTIPVKSLRRSDPRKRSETESSLAHIVVCRLFGAKPLSERMLIYWQFG